MKKEYLLLAIGVVVMGVGIWVKLARPLMWNDEATTAVFAESTLKHGYPKIHDGKHNLNPTIPDDKSLCVKESIDGYLCVGWGQYYWALPGVLLARLVDSLYLKTLLVRLPFGVAGFAALLILPLIVWGEIKKAEWRVKFLAMFLLIESLSVFLMLHIAQVRYYSLLMLLSYLLVMVYLKRKHIVLIPVLLVFIFVTYYPAYVAFVVAICVNELIAWLADKKSASGALGRVGLVLASGFAVLPMLGFFETFYISKQYSKYLLMSMYGMEKIGVGFMVRNMVSIFEFLLLNDFLFFYLMSMGVVGYLAMKKGLARYYRENGMFRAFVFLGIVMVMHVGVISRIPYVFSRYFVVLQPLMTFSVLMSGYIVLEEVRFDKEKIKAMGVFAGFVGLMFFVFKIAMYGRYVYELTHVYRGPLDYAMRYIEDNYDDPSGLTIATNYEELAYVYYFDAKTIVGAVGSNLEEDMKMTSDIIIPRKDWENMEYIKELKSRGDYNEIVLEVEDYRFNNISEMVWHLYKTPIAEGRASALKIYTRND